MSSAVNHILEIDSVALAFGDRQILSSVYLRVEQGASTALLGRNGCGKSCLMKILFGQLKPSFKSIRIDSVWQDKLSHRDVLYLPQSTSIPSYLKVPIIFKEFGVSLDDFLTYFPNLVHVKDNRIGELSGGEARLIEIFTILRADSKFVMLDEPFSQIMPLNVEVIKTIINEEKQKKGVLFTDHMYRNVIEVADTIYVIANQTVYKTKTAEDLIKYGYVNSL